MTKEELVRHAIEAMKRAYAPYSGCFVGAALLAENGQVYLGCNIENAAFGRQFVRSVPHCLRGIGWAAPLFGHCNRGRKGRRNRRAVCAVRRLPSGFV